MSEPIVRKRKIHDYVPDPHNANKGTERGQYMVDTSIEQVGAARSIVAAADDTVPAGNKTLQAAADAGIEDVIEVETDGKTLVVVKRIDWQTVDDEQARKYAYFDNRASETDLEWSATQIVDDIDGGIDLSDLWHEYELDEFRQLAEIEDGDLPEIDSARNLGETSKIVKLALYMPDVSILERAIRATGLKNRAQAVVMICEAFLDETGQFDTQL